MRPREYQPPCPRFRVLRLPVPRLAFLVFRFQHGVHIGKSGPAVGASSVSLDRFLRRLFPSTSKVTFNPLFRAAINAFNVIPQLIFAEFGTLPPNHLRIASVSATALSTINLLPVSRPRFLDVHLHEGMPTMRSDILDIGVAAAFGTLAARLNLRGSLFGGSYVASIWSRLVGRKKPYDRSASASIYKRRQRFVKSSPAARLWPIAFRCRMRRSI